MKKLPKVVILRGGDQGRYNLACAFSNDLRSIEEALEDAKDSLGRKLVSSRDYRMFVSELELLRREMDRDSLVSKGSYWVRDIYI